MYSVIDAAEACLSAEVAEEAVDSPLGVLR